MPRRRRVRFRPGSASEKWHTEVKLQNRINRQPSVAFVVGLRWPGAGLFYLRRHISGIITNLVFFIGVVGIFFIHDDFLAGFVPASWPQISEWGIIIKIALVPCFLFIFCIISAFYTLWVAIKDHRKAVADWELFHRENSEPPANR